MDEISETRKILEQEMAKLEKDQEADDLPAEIADEEDYSQLPETYAAEMADDFKLLPVKMQKYLHAKVKADKAENEKIRQEIESRKWIEEIYNHNAPRLQNYGLNNADEWFKHLAELDEAMEQNPQAVLQYLAQTYGVATPDKANLEKEMLQAKNGARMQDAWNEVSGFMQAVDGNGKAKYPFTEQVKAQIIGLLQCGAAGNLEDAYQKAIWLNPQVREKLIAEKAQAALREKAQEAEKAKEAAFAPQGRLSKADMSNMSTRELLMYLIDD